MSIFCTVGIPRTEIMFFLCSNVVLHVIRGKFSKVTRVFGTKTSTVMYTPFTFILNTPMQSYMCGGPPINPSSLENDSFMMNPHSPPAVPAAESRVTFGFHWIFSFSTPRMAPLCTAKLRKIVRHECSRPVNFFFRKAFWSPRKKYVSAPRER